MAVEKAGFQVVGLTPDLVKRGVAVASALHRGFDVCTSPRGFSGSSTKYFLPYFANESSGKGLDIDLTTGTISEVGTKPGPLGPFFYWSDNYQGKEPSTENAAALIKEAIAGFDELGVEYIKAEREGRKLIFH